VATRGRVLITGAAGNVGRGILPYIEARYDQLRLSDIIDFDGGPHQMVRCDLADFNAVRELVRDCSAILHFGGCPREAHWREIADANIHGSYNLLEAARREGISRVVIASSTHSVGFESREHLTPSTRNYRPDSIYGVSKLLSEGLASYYADRFGMEIMALRIGLYAPKPRARRNLANWVHAEDLAQLCLIGLEHPDVGYSVVYGVSQTECPIFDNSRAVELGYRPLHTSAVFAEEVGHLREETDGFVGGPFVIGPDQTTFE